MEGERGFPLNIPAFSAQDLGGPSGGPPKPSAIFIVKLCHLIVVERFERAVS